MSRDERARHYLSRFKEFVNGKVTRDKYTYLGIKPGVDVFYIVVNSKEASTKLREALGFFFHGIEISIMVIPQMVNRDEADKAD